MIRGEFFDRFFSERGQFEAKSNGEYNVLCPFPHDKGYETRPSAHVNVGKGVFDCRTCFAEGHLQTGGLSEISFMAKVYGISYEESIKLFSTLDAYPDMNPESWEKGKKLLRENPAEVEYLHKRGITDETIEKYDLAYSGDGIMYPIIMYGSLCDVRTYHPNATPKITSKAGASPFLFPFDHWRADNRETILVAGENDCLITRQYGFNALTPTAGEGTFPKIFARLFKDKKVYIVYDCDEAGKQAARRVAFTLRDAGAEVHLVDLGLPGTKDNKDLTDFFVKNEKSAEDLSYLMQNSPIYTDEEMQEDKNKEYPLVDLWDVAEGKYYGKRVSSRVILSGKYDAVMQTPSAIEWACGGADPDNPVCGTCPKAKKNKSGWWTLGENLKDIMTLVDVNDVQQTKAIDKFIKFPKDCPNGTWAIKSRQQVHKVVFTPDVETEDELSGFRSAEQYAYTIGMNLEDGNRYRAFFKSYAHPLDGQRVFMVVDRVEESDNALNAFRMTPEIKEQLKQTFQGDPTEKMIEFQKRLHSICGFLPKELLANAAALMYFSPLSFEMFGRIRKGYPEFMAVGEPRTGKTETMLLWQKYVRVGNFAPVKGATTAGLIGGADKLASGGFKVNWGTIPRNHKGLVILDEFSGMYEDVFSSLTSVRSEMIATVHKIVKGQAPAKTRLYWTSNPREVNGRQKKMREYNNGIELINDLIKHEEDIARFDVVLAIMKDGTESSPDDVPELEPYNVDDCRHLIYWVWSRKSEQVVFQPGVDKYIRLMADELNEKYDCEGAMLLGSEAWKKLSKIAVACAGATFSCDESGEYLIVTKEHVDWAYNFFIRAYDNNVFQLAAYVKKEKSLSTVTQAVVEMVHGLSRSTASSLIVKTLMESGESQRLDLQMLSGLQANEFNDIISKMYKSALVEVSRTGIKPTKRLKFAVESVRADFHKSRMVPLTEQGVDPI